VIPSTPFESRERRPPVRGFVARLGREGIEAFEEIATALRLLGSSLRAAVSPGSAARGAVHRVTLSQIVFTGAEGLPFVTATALILGATLMLQMRVAAPGLPGEIVGKVLVTLVLRELAPLVTAIIVASRSGTAIATEIGNMKASLEVLGLASMGIDPARYVVLPRLVAVVVSVVVLMVYFGILSLLGAFALAAVFGTPDLSAIRAGLADTLGVPDLALFAVKGAGCGALVATICCHYGMQVKGSITEVPMLTGKAVIRAVLGCVLYSFGATLAFYSLVGTPASQM
jgi:phospholipid/cholesterol/gamma-HCH transport system permease protein